MKEVDWYSLWWGFANPSTNKTKREEMRKMMTQLWYWTRKIWYRISETFWNRMTSQVRRCWGICEYLWILCHLSFKEVHVWYRIQNDNNDYDHSTCGVWLELNHFGNNKSEMKLCYIKQYFGIKNIHWRILLKLNLFFIIVFS